MFAIFVAVIELWGLEQDFASVVFMRCEPCVHYVESFTGDFNPVRPYLKAVSVLLKVFHDGRCTTRMFGAASPSKHFS